ncbi:hypothetical protein EON65_19125 [archaeon]|nr:MAG: hypothetical protein EON65_19125 [archaeon]
MRHDDCVICHDEALAAPSPALKPRITSPSSSMDSSSTGYSLLLCFMVFFYIPVAVSSICSYPERQISHVQLIFAVVLLTTVFISLFALVATIHTVFIGHYVPDFRAPTLSPYAALVAYSLASSCVLLLHATSPECIQDTMSFKAAWLCKIDGNLSAFPLLVSLTSPVVVASLLPATPHFTTASTYTLCLTWLITLVTLCACVGLTLSSSTIMTAVAYIFLSLTVCSSQLAKRTMTPTSRGLDEPSRALHSKAEMPCSIYERDSVGSDFSKDLMRQLIANVAHDLKTVSSGHIVSALLLVVLQVLKGFTGASFCLHSYLSSTKKHTMSCS